jgi:sortase A
MPDKRNVDELSLEELERVLIVKRREARQGQMSRLRSTGRVIEQAKEVPQPQEASSGESLQKRKSVPEFEDAIDAQDFKPRSNAGRIWGLFVDRSLLFMEIGAVVGLVVLGFALFNGVNILQEETAAAQAAAAAQLNASIPTLAPTPELSLANVVLPTGHIFQNQRPIFNFGEVPEAMLGVVANQIYLPVNVARAPVTDDTPLRLNVPRLNIDGPIVQGVDWNALQQGIGMLPNGSLPRNSGDNVVLAAHNDIYGEIFRDLDQLEAGDELQIQTRSGIYTYSVRETLLVAPDDVHVMESQGTAMVTLISCYPYQVNNQRIVVYADRVDA